MISIAQVESVEEVHELMPLFLEGFRAMNKRYKAFECDEQGFIKTLIWVLGTSPENGIMVVFNDDEPVGYGVALNHTPRYSVEKHLLLWAQYIKPAYSKLSTKVLMDSAAAMAKAEGYTHLVAYNGRLNGSSFNYFERVLGMRRHRMQFIKPL